jgi:hypothetical protein
VGLEPTRAMPGKMLSVVKKKMLSVVKKKKKRSLSCAFTLVFVVFPTNFLSSWYFL